MALTFYTGDFFLATYTAVSILLSILLTVNMPQGLWKMTRSSLRAFLQCVSSTENAFLPQLCHANALWWESCVFLKCAGPVAKRQWVHKVPVPIVGWCCQHVGQLCTTTPATENSGQMAGAEFLSTEGLQHEGFGGGEATSPAALVQG